MVNQLTPKEDNLKVIYRGSNEDFVRELANYKHCY